MIASREPWRTVHSRADVHAAHRFALQSALGGAGLAAFGLLVNARFTFWVLLVIYLVVAYVVFYRRLGMRVTTKVEGVHVVNMWNSHTVPWGEIANILASTTPIARYTESGEMQPPPAIWGALLESDSRLLLVHPGRGPERIMAMVIVCRTGDRKVFIDACDRETWEALTQAWEWHEENFARPLDFRLLDPPDRD